MGRTNCLHFFPRALKNDSDYPRRALFDHTQDYSSSYFRPRAEFHCTCTASMVFLKAHVSAPDTAGIPFPSLCTTAKEIFLATTRGSRKSRLCPVENTDKYSGTFLMKLFGQPSSLNMFLGEVSKEWQGAG